MPEGVQVLVRAKLEQAPAHAREQYVARKALERRVPIPTLAHIFSAPACRKSSVRPLSPADPFGAYVFIIYLAVLLVCS
jgi:hypothetical protein